jgi:hypothetical protein
MCRTGAKSLSLSQNEDRRTSRLIQRRATSFFEFGLPSPPWMAYTFDKDMNPAAKWTLITGGVLTLCGPVIGLLGTVISMMGSFKTLETSGVSDTDALASDISMTLLTTTGGIILGGIGVAILIVGLVIWLATRNVAKPPTLNL